MRPFSPLLLLFRFNKIRSSILILFIFSFMANIVAQSSDKHELPRNVIFKTSPKIDENTPDWAKMMYADFPNIYKVEEAYNEYYKTHTLVKNNDTQNYKHWKREVIHFVNDNGDFEAKDKSEENKAFRKIYEARRNRLKKKSNSSNWSLLGPNYTVSPNETTSTPGESQGNVKCLTISKSDPLIMYAGTESGGIYRTIDGGDSWTLFSSEMPLRRIDDIVISPRDNDVVYALGYTGSGLNEYALYILNDGLGQDWVELWSLSNNGKDGKIVLTDDELFREEFMIGIGRGSIGGLYHLTRNQIFQLEANQIFDEPVWDVTLKRGNNNVVYVLKSDESEKLIEFHKSTNGGTTFSKITNGWYASDNTDEDNKAFGAQFAQTDANSSVLYALVSAELKASDDGYLGIFKSSNSGDSWTLMNNHLGAPYSTSNHNVVANNFMGTNVFFQSPNNLALAVSDNDENELAVGGLDLSRSDDGGATFTRVAGYNAELSTTNFHVDVQELHFQNDDLWVTNDGGIAKTENLFSSLPIFLIKTFGLHATEFWGFGQGWNKDVVFGGTFHNGDKVYNKDAYANGAFKSINNGNAEEPSGSVHPIKDLLHGQHNGPNKSGIKRTRLPASETSKPVNLTEIILKNEVNETTFAQSPEIEYDFQNFDHWYLGSKQHLVYVKDEGASFDTIYSFSAGKILQIKVDRTNPLVFYVTVRTVENNQSIIRFYKSTDRGNTFVQKGQDYLAFGATMDINHHLGYTYLALYSGSDPAKNKIYRSFTRGEDWSEANLGILEGLRLHYIVSAQDDDRELCYIGTNLGVYKLENLVVSDMSLGLPIAASIRKLAIFHRDSKLRAATTGYGVFEIDIPESTPLITPTVNNMGSSSCLATFQFDSYSIINQEGVTWEWTFSRTPAEIDDYNIRNPVVSFYAGNPVTATLNVTKNGTTYSKTLENIPISCETVIETVQHATAQNDGCYRLTTNSTKRYGAVWGTQKLDLSKAFSLSCTLDLGNLPGNSGGGISFVLQRQGIDANGTPKEAGNQGISPSLAVVFRTWTIDQIFIVPKVKTIAQIFSLIIPASLEVDHKMSHSPGIPTQKL